MELENLPTSSVWPGVAAIGLAVFVPFIIWCIYAFRMRQITMRSVLGLAAAEIAALIAIAVLAHF
ncbi:MAG TPA: hypothetical protein VG826_34455 [Pirellulales bacterium]|nr:hypothetical protein [Pirellulales bacterium]